MGSPHVADHMISTAVYLEGCHNSEYLDAAPIYLQLAESSATNRDLSPNRSVCPQMAAIQFQVCHHDTAG